MKKIQKPGENRGSSPLKTGPPAQQSQQSPIKQQQHVSFVDQSTPTGKRQAQSKSPIQRDNTFVNPLYTGYESNESQVIKPGNARKTAGNNVTPPKKTNVPVQQPQESKSPLKIQRVSLQAPSNNQEFDQQNKKGFSKVSANRTVEPTLPAIKEENLNPSKRPQNAFDEHQAEGFKQTLEKLVNKDLPISDETNFKQSSLQASILGFQSGEASQLLSKYKQLLSSKLQKDPRQATRLQMMQEYALNLQRQRHKELYDINLTINSMSKEKQRQLAKTIKSRVIQSPKHQKKNSLNDLPFSYRYLMCLQNNRHSIVQLCRDFQIHCETLMKQLVDDIFKKSQSSTFIGRIKQKSRNNNIISYQFDELQIKLGLTILKLVPLKSNQAKEQSGKKEERISDYSSAKELSIQYKNYCILNELLYKTLNKKSQSSSPHLAVPLITLVQHHGFIALFKLCCKFGSNSLLNNDFIKQKQKQITKIVHIQTNLLEQKKIKIQHVAEDYYNKLWQQNNFGYSKDQANERKFNIDIVQQVKEYLLRDYLAKSNNGVLRSQFIFYSISHNEQLSQYVFSNPSEEIKEKNPAKYKEQEEILKTISNEVLEKLSQFILKNDSSEFYYLHPDELSRFLHQNGVNIRYMGLAFDNLNQPFAKKYLMTEITARACKLLLRKTIHDIYQQKKQEDQKYSILADIIDFLNCIFGSSHQTNAMWQVIRLHSMYYFKTKISRQQIEKAYFLISLMHHCKLEINWSLLKPISQIFQTESYFTSQIITGLKTVSKIQSMIEMDDKYTKITQILKEQPNEEGFREIVSELNLTVLPLPYITDDTASPLHQVNLKLYLSHFIKPETPLINKQSSFCHISPQIYSSPSTYPTKYSLAIRIIEIKWYLRMKNSEKYLQKCQQFISHVQKFYGDFHISLSELYEMFSAYHLLNQQYQDAITFAKSSLVNMLKICGPHHLKTAECYYNLALILYESNKMEESGNMLKKAKLIFESKNKILSLSYATINLKLATILCNKKDFSQCSKVAEKALQIYDSLLQHQQVLLSQISNNKSSFKSEFQFQKSQMFELLFQCYSELKNTQKLDGLFKSVEKYIKTVKQPLNLGKLLGIAFAQLLKSMPQEEAAEYLQLIQQILLEITPKNFYNAYTLLKKRISQSSLIQNFKNYLENFSSVYDYISVNQSMKNWKPLEGRVYERETVNDFICLTEELLYFLGEEWFRKVLQRQT